MLVSSVLNGEDAASILDDLLGLLDSGEFTMSILLTAYYMYTYYMYTSYRYTYYLLLTTYYLLLTTDYRLCTADY